LSGIQGISSETPTPASSSSPSLCPVPSPSLILETLLQTEWMQIYLNIYRYNFDIAWINIAAKIRSACSLEQRRGPLGKMGLDLLLFQADKDGDPELIKQSQSARFKSEAIVDEIQQDYKQWTRGT
jgi:hypothetical protein